MAATKKPSTRRKPRKPAKKPRAAKRAIVQAKPSVPADERSALDRLADEVVSRMTSAGVRAAGTSVLRFDGEQKRVEFVARALRIRLCAERVDVPAGDIFESARRALARVVGA